ncbi:MAG: prepilin peptidase [Neisseria sp.]|nr:prepilin peptidase [Neisseria sp.]
MILDIFFANSFTFYLFALFLGLIVGSFLNVVVHRLPKMLENEWTAFAREQLNLPAEATPNMSLWQPASHCPHCQSTIRRRHNIPVLGFVWLGGRCACCQQPIARHYLLLEVLTGALFVLMAWLFGASVYTVFAWLFASFLLAAAWIDAQTQLLPDSLTLPLLWLGLLYHALFEPQQLSDSVLAAVCAYLFLWTLNAIHKKLRGIDGMGGGDAKLFAALGACLGVFSLPLIMFAAAVGTLIAAAVLGKQKNQAIAFGPALAVCGLAYCLLEPTLIAHFAAWLFSGY